MWLLSLLAFLMALLVAASARPAVPPHSPAHPVSHPPADIPPPRRRFGIPPPHPAVWDPRIHASHSKVPTTAPRAMVPAKQQPASPRRRPFGIPPPPRPASGPKADDSHQVPHGSDSARDATRSAPGTVVDPAKQHPAPPHPKPFFGTRPPPPRRTARTSSSTRRACTTVYPTLRTAASQPPPYLVTVNASAGVELGFAVPDDAVGSCNLMLQLPSGLTGAGQVNVVALDGPAPGALVGTVDFQPGAQATINSFACRSQMCYSLQLVGGSGKRDEGAGGHGSHSGSASGSGEAELTFMEEQGAGVVMTYGC